MNPTLLGHAASEQALAGAARSGRLAHAWLITGPPGIGKATLAFRFARHLLAGGWARANPPLLVAAGEARDENPDGAGEGEGGLFVAPDAPAFRRVASGGHADLLTVERGYDDRRDRLRREIVVDDIRAVGAFLAQTPAEGGWRIVIVDSADALNRNAANALLKVLEEPPDRALLLLISNAPGGLLPTIRSRCRRLALPPLPADIVDTLLARYRPDIAPGERAALVDLAGGSIGRALSLADARVGALQREIRRLFSSLPALEVAALHRLCDDAVKQNEDGFAILADIIRWWLAGLTRRASGAATVSTADTGSAGSTGSTGSAGSVGGAGGGREASIEAVFDTVARAAPLDRWLEVWEKSERLLAVTDSVNLDRKQVLLSIFLDIAAATRR